MLETIVKEEFTDGVSRMMHRSSPMYQRFQARLNNQVRGPSHFNTMMDNARFSRFDDDPYRNSPINNGPDLSYLNEINRIKEENKNAYLPPGRQDNDQFIGGIGLSGGNNIHFHGSDPDHLTHGHILDKDRNIIGDDNGPIIFNGYQASMIDYMAEQENMRKYGRGGYGTNY
jgi:hypothetical protein